MNWREKLKQRLSGGPNLEFDVVKEAVVEAETGVLNTSDVDALIATFRSQRDILSNKIGTYPGNAVNAKDWLDGVGLGHLAVRFACILEDAERFEAEFLMRELAVNIGCIVEGHYQHVIGPRMVALIRSADRLGKTHVQSLCDAVVVDFMWILEANMDETTALSAEDALSIWSLRFALEREASLTAPPKRSFTVADADKALERAPLREENADD